MVGDVAIAVHPEDPRYKHLHGKFALHPFISGRRMPIVLDDILVDMELGTGAVKVTPAHDPNDFACGERHKLEFINILNDDGTLNENAGPFKVGHLNLSHAKCKLMIVSAPLGYEAIPCSKCCYCSPEGERSLRRCRRQPYVSVLLLKEWRCH